MAGRHLNSRVEVGAFHDGIADLLLRLGEGPVGHQDLTVADTHDPGLAGPAERAAGQQDPALGHLFHPRDGDRFAVRIGPGTVTARRLLVATGVRDELPDVPGLAARWGIDVLHCPYCHGWEVRDKRIGILATGPAAVHQALLFRQLSAHVTLLKHAGPGPAAEQCEQLAAAGVALVEGPVEAVDAAGGRLTGVRLVGGRRMPLDAVVVAPRMVARAELLAPLGLEPAELRMGEHVIGTRIEADHAGATAVPGVRVAGNIADPQAQVVMSAAAGLTAGAAINYDLVLEEARHAAASALQM
jgi:thioredoxin reductase